MVGAGKLCFKELSRAARFSYGFMFLLLILLVALHLATPLLSALFSYLTLTRLELKGRGGKAFAITMFILLIAAAGYGLGYFGRQSVRALPEIADRSIPSVIDRAKQRGIELPFTDYDSLKDVALDTAKREAKYFAGFAKFARGATKHVLLLIAGLVIAMSLFLNRDFELGSQKPGTPLNLYSEACAEIAARFATLYQSFKTVMGAQIIISAINTVLTAIFVLALGFPYTIVIIGATFICGLLPVVGNILSNTIVVMVGFTISPKMALIALIFLVVVHKLEYFLNSKIVGWRIRNPLWLTLLGLMIGEELMGIPGMILAPVMLNCIKLEASAFLPSCKTEPD